MSDQRVVALNAYVRQLEEENLKLLHGIIKQKELFLEQQMKRFKTYSKVREGKKLEPILKSDAEYYCDSIQEDIKGLSNSIMQDRERMIELEKIREAKKKK